ncbi:MAG: ABC transporter ATP-binding protein [Phycisphaerales bacterium JB063]
MEIRIDRLHKSFGKTVAVDDLSFSFASGQIFAFVGPNGAGKTTTMRILASLDEPTSGRCTIDGVSVVEEPEKARRNIGYMPDNLPAHRDLNVHEYLDFFARAYGLRGKTRIQMIDQIESFTNLSGIREKSLRALSKGMKQRVSLARALIHDPPLLIMDEPAAGLDPRARIELRELLKALSAQGKAILISSHILTELAEVCDGAVIIERGKLLRAGTMQDIYNFGRSADEPMQHIAVRTKANNEKLHQALLEMPGVVKATIVANRVEADVSGDEEDCCDLLAALLEKGFRIMEFKQIEADLEQLFMNITRGEVQ